MQVDQRRVTAISLRDGCDRECLLVHDGAGYRLSFVSRDDVVNLYLSAADLHKLRQEIAVRSGREIRKDRDHESISGWSVHQPGMKESYGHPTSVDNAHFAWTSADWLAYN
jgi:hypothetical protein